MGISHLQYADDALCIIDASVTKIWILKALSIGFNFLFFFGVEVGCLNVPVEFMVMASDFLIVTKVVFHLNIWGFLVGANAMNFFDLGAFVGANEYLGNIIF